MPIDNRTIESVFLEYRKKNKSPKGKYHCSVPHGPFKKWDVVENIGNTATKGCLYIVVGYLKNTDFYGAGIQNKDGSKNGYILLRTPGYIETALPRDFLAGTGRNLIAERKRN